MFHVKNLSKSYGTRQVLRNLSLRVAQGEVYGFVGGNGAGKTTAMRAMLGISSADAGTVLLDGHPITNRARSTIGYMPEERGLYPKMTLIAQLTHFAVLHGLTSGSARAAAEYWLQRLGLGDRRGSALESLSLGNQQRVQFAAALLHNPRILVLDEPFSGLDPQAVTVMVDVLKEEARRGVPVVFSSHQLDLVERLCNRIGILRDGRLVAEGTVDELAASVGHQLVIRSPIPRQAWLTELPAHIHGSKGHGVTVEAEDGRNTRIKLHGSIDPQAVLDAARRHGPVDAFFRWRPTLNEIYSDAMADTAHERNEGKK